MALPHRRRGNFAVRVKLSQAEASKHLLIGNYLSSQKLFREHKQILGARFPRRNAARSTPFLAVAATSERCHCTVCHPLTSTSFVTGETLTRERSCTGSRPSQHTQRLPRPCLICRTALQTTIARSPEGIHCKTISRSYVMLATAKASSRTSSKAWMKRYI